MAKLESVTLARRTLKQPKFKYMPESKTLWELYERFCQAGQVEELHRIDRSKILIKSNSLSANNFKSKASNLTNRNILLNKLQPDITFHFMQSDIELTSYKIQIHQRLLEDYD